jgi:hypothetical protein
MVLASGARQFWNSVIGKHWFSGAAGFRAALVAGWAEAGAAMANAATTVKLAAVDKERSRIIDI